jgi:mannose-1-phosphate guanylyltransferase
MEKGMIIPIILSGGTGSRLWTLSRDIGTPMKLRDSISLKGNFGDVMLCNGWAIGVKAVWIVCSRKSVILI